MKINRNNYEAFFIDYLEGNLDEKLVDDFIEFLQQNGDLKEELSLFETVSIGQEEMTFSKKELLLKEKYDIESEFNQAAVARLEGDISEFEKQDSKTTSPPILNNKKRLNFSIKQNFNPTSLWFSAKKRNCSAILRAEQFCFGPHEWLLFLLLR